MMCKDYLVIEKKKIFQNTSRLHLLKMFFIQDSVWKRWLFVKYMRKAQFSSGLLSLWYTRKKNIIGNQLGFEIVGTNIGCGLTLYHNGPIVINSKSVIGKGVKFHGDNCVGNNGKSEEYPIIGNNVDVGVGAKILGGIRIAEGVKIGAGAIVLSDITQSNCTVVGIPAHMVDNTR